MAGWPCLSHVPNVAGQECFCATCRQQQRQQLERCSTTTNGRDVYNRTFAKSISLTVMTTQHLQPLLQQQQQLTVASTVEYSDISSVNHMDQHIEFANRYLAPTAPTPQMRVVSYTQYSVGQLHRLFERTLPLEQNGHLLAYHQSVLDKKSRPRK